MQKINLAGLLLIAATACHKSSEPSVGPVSLNVINAQVTSPSIVPVLSTANLTNWFANASPIGFGNSAIFSPVSGSDTVFIAQTTDIGGPKPIWLFGGVLPLSAYGIYSFFITGDSTNTDTLLVKDNIPSYQDSSAGVRIVNLITGSQPISVNLQGNPTSQMEFGPQGYKTISTFKKYIANSSIPGSYTFEIRDFASGRLLNTFTWNFTLGKNNTIVVSGSENGGVQVFQINNF